MYQTGLQPLPPQTGANILTPGPRTHDGLLFDPQRPEEGRQTRDLITAMVSDLIAGGVRFGAGYPITPWSDIMELLRRELPKYGGSFIQCEDEIASVSMAIGASYAGVVSVTGSSGPGISLKSEALGWALSRQSRHREACDAFTSVLDLALRLRD